MAAVLFFPPNLQAYTLIAWLFAVDPVCLDQQPQRGFTSPGVEACVLVLQKGHFANMLHFVKLQMLKFAFTFMNMSAKNHSEQELQPPETECLKWCTYIRARTTRTLAVAIIARFGQAAPLSAREI